MESRVVFNVNWSRFFSFTTRMTQRAEMGFKIQTANFTLSDGNAMAGRFRLEIYKVPQQEYQIHLLVLFTFHPFLVALEAENRIQGRGLWFSPTPIYINVNLEPKQDKIMAQMDFVPTCVRLRLVKNDFSNHHRMLHREDFPTLLTRYVFGNKYQNKGNDSGRLRRFAQYYNAVSNTPLFLEQEDPVLNPINKDKDVCFRAESGGFELWVPLPWVLGKSDTLKYQHDYAKEKVEGVIVELEGVDMEDSMKVIKEFFFHRQISPPSISFLRANIPQLCALAHFAEFCQIRGLIIWLGAIIKSMSVSRFSDEGFLELYANVLVIPSLRPLVELFHWFLVHEYADVWTTPEWLQFDQKHPELCEIIRKESLHEASFGRKSQDNANLRDYRTTIVI